MDEWVKVLSSDQDTKEENTSDDYDCEEMTGLTKTNLPKDTLVIGGIDQINWRVDYVFLENRVIQVYYGFKLLIVRYGYCS